MHQSLQADPGRLSIRLAHFGALVAVVILQFVGLPSASARDDPWDPWKACCDIVIMPDQRPGPPLRMVLLNWQRQTAFTGNGAPGELVDADRPPFHSWKKQQIAASLTEFLQTNPDGGDEDYFRSIGMTCGADGAATKVKLCRAEAPIVIQCIIFRGLPQDLVSVPEPLRGALDAFLRVTVEISPEKFQSTVSKTVPPFEVTIERHRTLYVATYSRIIAQPGGHLCTR